MARRSWRDGALLFGALGLSACTPRTHRYESVCQLIRRDVVEEDDKGRTTQVDIELEWDPCPGDQFQVVRGGAAFAQCLEKYSVGDLLPVTVRHWWDTRGFYTWDLERVGDCAHPIEPGSAGSFEKSQECSDTLLHGTPNGFQCNRRPFAKLLSVCPWTRRE